MGRCSSRSRSRRHGRVVRVAALLWTKSGGWKHLYFLTQGVGVSRETAIVSAAGPPTREKNPTQHAVRLCGSPRRRSAAAQGALDAWSRWQLTGNRACDMVACMRARRWAVWTTAMALGLMCAGGAAASSASATTYCVGDPNCVIGGGTSEPDLQSALTDASLHTGDDGVQVGPGTFQAAGPGGFQYGAPAGNTVQLVGAGSDQTILTAPNITSGTGIITLDVEMASGGGSTVSDLAVQLPGVTSGAGQSVGIYAKGAEMNHVAVTTPSSVNGGPAGVEFQTGTLQHSTVSVPLTLGGAAAVRVNDGQSGTIADSTLSGYYGIYGDASSTPTTITALRDRIQGGDGASIYTRATSLTADDSLIQTNQTGVHTFSNATLDGTSTLRNVTIAGDPVYGLYDESTTSGRTATINLDSSIIDTEFFSIFRDGGGPSGGTANVATNYSNYPDFTGSTLGSAGSLTETSVMRVDPMFVDSAGQDFHLRFDSPLLDQGNPTNSGGSTDLDGLPRVVHGRLDMGAFEYQRRQPSAAASATPGTVQTGQAAAFKGTGSRDPDPGDTLAYAWTFDDGATATGLVASHTFTTAGSHTGTLTVTDPTGLQASASASVTVIASPSVGGPTGQRAVALKKCKKKHKRNHNKKKFKKCKKRAKRRPV